MMSMSSMTSTADDILQRRPGGAGVASRRPSSSSDSHTSESQFTMFSRLGVCSTIVFALLPVLMARIGTVIEFSAGTCALSPTQPFLLHSIPPHAHRHQHSTIDRSTRILMSILSPESCPPTTSTPSTAKTKARQWACIRRTISRCKR